MSQRSRSSLTPFVTAAVVAVVLLFARLALAAADPLSTATVSVDTLASMVTSYGWIVGGVIIAYALTRTLLRLNDSKHWIAQGRTLAVIAALVGVGGTALQALFSGSSWAGVLATAVIGVVHLLDANTTPAVPVKDAPAKSSALPMLAVIVLGLVGAGSLTACNPSSPLHPVVDCTVADQAQIQALIAELSPILQAKAPDWTTLEKDAIAAGETIGGCALAAVIQGYLAPKAGVAAPDPLNGQIAHAVLEDYRARYANGSTFRTPHGDL